MTAPSPLSKTRRTDCRLSQTGVSSQGVHSGPTASDLGREEFMDFIERLFGISPDAGSGATEAMIVLVPLSIVAFLAYRRIRQDSTRPPATGPR